MYEMTRNGLTRAHNGLGQAFGDAGFKRGLCRGACPGCDARESGSCHQKMSANRTVYSFV